jgi:hypothetical protein
MMGIRQATAGPGRQVQDASFFVSLLRTKITECSAECSKMRTDIERISKDSSLMTQLERKYEGLIKEVRELEGSLADYNLAMDKSRTRCVSSQPLFALCALLSMSAVCLCVCVWGGGDKIDSLYLPDRWHPPSLSDIAARTRVR